MATEKLGVEELKKFLHSVLKAFEKGYDVMKDGKIKGMEWVEVPVIGFNIYKAVSIAPEAYEQWQDLDDEEFAEVMAFVKEDFDIPDDVLEEKIENLLVTLISLGETITDFFEKSEG